MDETHQPTVIQLPEAGPDVADEHRFQQEYLYAFAPQLEVTNHIRTQAIGIDQDRQSQILSDWALLQPTVQQLGMAEAGLADTIELSPVDPGLNQRVAGYLADPLFGRQFNMPFDVAVVEVRQAGRLPTTGQLRPCGTTHEAVRPEPDR
jgi:hypothetical protein